MDRGWWEWLVGGPRRLGLWTLPLFVAVALLGAVLAGTLATVYFSQKINRLERDTAAARRDIAAVIERVSEAADEAVATINREVGAVRDELGVTLPLEDPAAAGLAAVEVSVRVRERVAPPAGPGATEPPPTTVRTEVRRGSAFAIISADGQTFFATSFELVADPERPDVAVSNAAITFQGQTTSVAVHSWDPQRDLALLRADGLSGVGVLDWRPEDAALPGGTRLFAAGYLPSGSLVQVPATVGAADSVTILTDAAVVDVVRGGPLVDGEGRVVGITSSAYQPYGGGSVGGSAVPVRMLCARLVRCSGDDLRAG